MWGTEVVCWVPCRQVQGWRGWAQQPPPVLLPASCAGRAGAAVMLWWRVGSLAPVHGREWGRVWCCQVLRGDRLREWGGDGPYESSMSSCSFASAPSLRVLQTWWSRVGGVPPNRHCPPLLAPHGPHLLPAHRNHRPCIHSTPPTTLTATSP